MRIRTLSLLTVAMVIAAVAPLAGAEEGLLAYEGFDYETGELTDKGSAEDAGWGGAWKVAKSDGISVSVLEEGLTFSTLKTSGRALRLQTNLERGFARFNRAARALAPKDEVTGTVWHSHLIHVQPMTRKLEDGEPKAETIDALEQRWEARVDVDSDGDTDRTGLPDVMGFAAKADAKGALGRLVVAGKNVTSVGSAVDLDATYMVLGKVEGLGGTDTVEVSTVDPETGESVQTQGYRYKATMWVLSEDNFKALAESDWDESVLDDEHVQHATLNVETDRKATFSSDDFVQIHTRDWFTKGFSPIYDEIRYGETLKSVAPVPEPEKDEEENADEDAE